MISAQAQSVTSSAFACSELPFNSFPPNQLLRQEENDGSAVSLHHAGRPGVWGGVIQVDELGSYLFSITGLKGPDKGICQAVVDENSVGNPIDLYDAADEKLIDQAVGMLTFLKVANYSFRFLVTKKNSSSSGYTAAWRKITLTPTKGFTLLSANGSCQPDGHVLLHWKAWPAQMGSVFSALLVDYGAGVNPTKI